MNSNLKDLESFLENEQDRLAGFVRKRLRDSAESTAEDIVQETVLSVVESLSFDRVIENIGALVYRSLKNRIIDHYRKRVLKTVSLDDAVMESGYSLAEILADLRYDTHIEAERHEIENRILKAVKKLPLEYQTVWIETEMKDRSFESLSREWDIPVGTLLARKHRANLRLRKELADLMSDK